MRPGWQPIETLRISFCTLQDIQAHPRSWTLIDSAAHFCAELRPAAWRFDSVPVRIQAAVRTGLKEKKALPAIALAAHVHVSVECVRVGLSRALTILTDNDRITRLTPERVIKGEDYRASIIIVIFVIFIVIKIMPSFHKKSSPSLVGSAPDQVRAPTTESRLSLRSLFSRKARAPAVTEPLTVPVPVPDREQQKEPDSIPSALQPTSSLPSPSSLRPEPESELEPPKESQTQAQTTWEDIDPPTALLSLAADHSISSASIASRYQQSTQTEPTVPVPTSNPTTTMLISSSPSPSTPSLLPSYSDVSGAVVVDAYGTPRFLTPQEEQERKEALAQAVRERMMGLPRRTDFSWEASATPVLPRYENAAVAGKLEGG